MMLCFNADKERQYCNIRTWQERGRVLHQDIARENLPEVKALRIKVKAKKKRNWNDSTIANRKRIKAEADQQQDTNRSRLIQRANAYLITSNSLL